MSFFPSRMEIFLHQFVQEWLGWRYLPEETPESQCPYQKPTGGWYSLPDLSNQEQVLDLIRELGWDFLYRGSPDGKHHQCVVFQKVESWEANSNLPWEIADSFEKAVYLALWQSGQRLKKVR